MSDQPERRPNLQDQESDDWTITVGYFQSARAADTPPAEAAKPKRHYFSEDGEIRPLEEAEIQTFEQLAAQLVPQYLDSTQELHKEVSHLVNLSQHWLDLSAEISKQRAEFRNPIYLNLISVGLFVLIARVAELPQTTERIALIVLICAFTWSVLGIAHNNSTVDKKVYLKRNRNDLLVIEDDFDDLANLLNKSFTTPATGKQLRKRGITAVKTIRKTELEQEAKAAANRAYEASVERARRRINNNRD